MKVNFSKNSLFTVMLLLSVITAAFAQTASKRLITCMEFGFDLGLNSFHKLILKTNEIVIKNHPLADYILVIAWSSKNRYGVV